MGCYNSIVIEAPSNEVWSILRNFHDMSWSPNVITKLEIKGLKSFEEIGAQRILNDAFHETLLSLDDNQKKLKYRIDDGPAAVSSTNVTGYIGIIQVFPITSNNNSFVLWTSQWEYTRDGGIEDFCNPIYRALLEDLNQHFSTTLTGV